MAKYPPPLIPKACHFKTLVKAIEVEHLRKSGKAKGRAQCLATLDVTYHLRRGVHIGNAKEMANVQNSDIHASKGVIHVVDRVILP